MWEPDFKSDFNHVTSGAPIAETPLNLKQISLAKAAHRHEATKTRLFQ
jgi:hypothetical protein